MQEELDWRCYQIWDLLSQFKFEDGELRPENYHYKIDQDHRPFLWQINEPHPGLPIPLARIYSLRRRIAASELNIRLIEDKMYKRLWLGRQGIFGSARVTFEERTEDALQEFLNECLESYVDFDGRMNNEGKSTARLEIALVSVARLGDVARQDTDFMQVAELYRNDPAFDVQNLVDELIEAESVPLLPVLRYKDTGLRKRVEWEQTWDLQRQEDVIDARTELPKDDPNCLSELDAKALKCRQIGDIPVLPKYTSGDFQNSNYWRLRGKLDVPKERWVSFPYCEGEDGSLMIAWAGYDHLQLARAISAYYVDVQERLGGRDDPRLVPLLACLLELLPWLKQWHNAADPEFGLPMGDYFEGFIQEEARQIGKTVDEIRAWAPPKKAAQRKRN